MAVTNKLWAMEKTTYTFEFSFKSSSRIRYFSSCAKKKVKFCCPVKYVNIHIFSQLTWFSKQTVGDGEKLLIHLNSALKVLLGLDIFLCVPKKKLNFFCPVKYVNIHIFSQLTWLSQTNCG